YALLHRDFESLKAVNWSALVLDEAQNIKNPETKQVQAARNLKADYRIALTGTPVENHVGDLWSIMEFLNAGWLGTQAEFKRNFHVPIQAQQDAEAAQQLQRLTGPFILVRVSQFSHRVNQYVLLRPPCLWVLSWALRSNQDSQPQGGRSCSLPPPS